MAELDDQISPTSIALVAWAINGFIGPNVREIRITYTETNNKIDSSFFFNTPPTDEEIDDASCAVTELVAQTDLMNFDFQVVFLPYPEKVPNQGTCIYRRYEPKTNPEPMTWDSLMVAASQAMLGRIHSNIREISLIQSEDNKAVRIFVCFDSAPTPRQTRDIDVIISEMSDHFASDIAWDKEIVVLPFPAKFSKGEMCLYCRSEMFPEDEAFNNMR